MNSCCSAYNSSLVKYFTQKNLEVENIFLYGAGGMGKTTAIKALFCYLVELAKRGEPIVPIYIDIKKIDEDVNKPLMHYIYSVYSGGDTDIVTIEKLFLPHSSTTTNAYRYFILIDGYNEVPIHLADDINREINTLKACKNVRLVVSSRVNKDNSQIFKDFVKIEMRGLSDKQIINYLKKFFNQNIDLNKVNKHLLSLLRTPLYLDTFTRTYGKNIPYKELYNSKKIRSGNILDDFIFHSLKKLQPELYIGDRLAEFILLYFMPALAFKIYKNNSYVIEDFEFAELSGDISYFRTLLGPKKSSEYIEVYKRNVDNIELICCDNLAILSRIENGYEMHHVWRDYFTSKHIINCMNFCKADDLEVSANYDIRKFTGELLREYDKRYGYSVNYETDNDDRKCECDFEKKNNLESWSESPIEHFMQRYYSELNKHPQAISNLINIMKTSRSYHITACYNNLELKYADFYTPVLDIKNSSFKHAKIYPSNFILGSQNGILPRAEFIYDGSMIFCEFEKSFGIWNVQKSEYYLLASRCEFANATVSKNCQKVALVSSKDKSIITIKDIRTNKTSILSNKNFQTITNLHFLDNDSKLVASARNSVLLFDTSKKSEPYAVLEGRLMNISPFGNLICYLRDNSLFAYNVEEKREIYLIDDVNKKHTINAKGSYNITDINYVYCSDDCKNILVIYSDRSMKMFKNGKMVFEKDFLKSDMWVTSIAVLPDLSKIAVACAGNGIYIFNSYKNEIIMHINSELALPTRTLAFSHGGDQLISGGNGICIWKLSNIEKSAFEFEKCSEIIEKLIIAESGKMIIGICQDKTIRFFNDAGRNYLALTDAAEAHNLSGCDFTESLFVGNNEQRFYNRMYLNGAAVDKRFISSIIRLES